MSQETLVIANYAAVQDLQSNVDLQNNAGKVGFWFFPLPQGLLLREVLSMVEAKTIHTIMTFPMQKKQLRPNDLQYYSPTAALPGFFNRQLSLLPCHSSPTCTLLLQCLNDLSLFSCNASALDEAIITTENYKHFSILLLWGQLLSLSNETGFM